jgi:hypothetical protein
VAYAPDWQITPWQFVFAVAYNLFFAHLLLLLYNDLTPHRKNARFITKGGSENRADEISF